MFANVLRDVRPFPKLRPALRYHGVICPTQIEAFVYRLAFLSSSFRLNVFLGGESAAHPVVRRTAVGDELESWLAA